MSTVVAAFIIGAVIFTAAFGLMLAGLAWLSRFIGRRRPTTQGARMNNDTITVRLVVGGLLLITLVIVCGAIWLTSVDRGLPDALIALGGTALGGTASFLVSSSSSKEAQAVNVVNPPDEPVPVEPGE